MSVRVFVRFRKCIVDAEFVFFLKGDYFLMSRAVNEPANLKRSLLLRVNRQFYNFYSNDR